MTCLDPPLYTLRRVRQLLADNQGLLNRIFDIVFDVGGGSDDGAPATPVYISPAQLADRRAAEERRAAGTFILSPISRLTWAQPHDVRSIHGAPSVPAPLQLLRQITIP